MPFRNLLPGEAASEESHLFFYASGVSLAQNASSCVLLLLRSNADQTKGPAYERKLHQALGVLQCQIKLNGAPGEKD